MPDVPTIAESGYPGFRTLTWNGLVGHGHSIDSFRGDRDRALAEQARLEALCGVPFVTPSIAVLAGLEAIGEPRRIAVLTPCWPPADTVIMDFFAACGYQVVGAVGLKATGPTAVARITPDEIRAGFQAVDSAQADVLVHVGTNPPVSAITEDIERTHGKPLIGVNVATCWQALRRIGVEDRIPGFGQLSQPTEKGAAPAGGQVASDGAANCYASAARRSIAVVDPCSSTGVARHIHDRRRCRIRR